MIFPGHAKSLGLRESHRESDPPVSSQAKNLINGKETSATRPSTQEFVDDGDVDSVVVDDDGTVACRTLWLTNLPPHVDGDTLLALFNRFGRVESTSPQGEDVTQYGFGYINFESVECAVNAWRELKGTKLFGDSGSTTIRFDRKRQDSRNPNRKSSGVSSKKMKTPKDTLSEWFRSKEEGREKTKSSSESLTNGHYKVPSKRPSMDDAKEWPNGPPPKGPSAELNIISPPPLRRGDSYRPAQTSFHGDSYRPGNDTSPSLRRGSEASSNRSPRYERRVSDSRAQENSDYGFRRSNQHKSDEGDYHMDKGGTKNKSATVLRSPEWKRGSNERPVERTDERDNATTQRDLEFGRATGTSRDKSRQEQEQSVGDVAHSDHTEKFFNSSASRRHLQLQPPAAPVSPAPTVDEGSEGQYYSPPLMPSVLSPLPQSPTFITAVQVMSPSNQLSIDKSTAHDTLTPVDEPTSLQSLENIATKSHHHSNPLLLRPQWRLNDETSSMHSEPVSDVTGSTSSLKRRKCYVCRAVATEVSLLFRCSKCSRRYHLRCGTPSPSSFAIKDKFVCEICVGDGGQRDRKESARASTRLSIHTDGRKERHRSPQPAENKTTLREISSLFNIDRHNHQNDRSRSMGNFLSTSRAPISTESNHSLPPHSLESLSNTSTIRPQTDVENSIALLESARSESDKNEGQQYHSLDARHRKSGSVGKRYTCHYWKTKGTCRYTEDECHYAHHDTGLDAGKSITCFYWNRGGCRRREEDCLYAHHDTGLYASEPRASENPFTSIKKSERHSRPYGSSSMQSEPVQFWSDANPSMAPRSNLVSDSQKAFTYGNFEAEVNHQNHDFPRQDNSDAGGLVFERGAPTNGAQELEATFSGNEGLGITEYYEVDAISTTTRTATLDSTDKVPDIFKGVNGASNPCSTRSIQERENSPKRKLTPSPSEESDNDQFSAEKMAKIQFAKRSGMVIDPRKRKASVNGTHQTPRRPSEPMYDPLSEDLDPVLVAFETTTEVGPMSSTISPKTAVNAIQSTAPPLADIVDKIGRCRGCAKSLFGNSTLCKGCSLNQRAAPSVISQSPPLVTILPDEQQGSVDLEMSDAKLVSQGLDSGSFKPVENQNAFKRPAIGDSMFIPRKKPRLLLRTQSFAEKAPDSAILETLADVNITKEAAIGVAAQPPASLEVLVELERLKKENAALKEKNNDLEQTLLETEKAVPVREDSSLDDAVINQSIVSNELELSNGDSKDLEMPRAAEFERLERSTNNLEHILGRSLTSSQFPLKPCRAKKARSNLDRLTKSQIERRNNLRASWDPLWRCTECRRRNLKCVHNKDLEIDPVKASRHLKDPPSSYYHGHRSPAEIALIRKAAANAPGFQGVTPERDLASAESDDEYSVHAASEDDDSSTVEVQVELPRKNSVPGNTQQAARTTRTTGLASVDRSILTEADRIHAKWTRKDELNAKKELEKKGVVFEDDSDSDSDHSNLDEVSTAPKGTTYQDPLWQGVRSSRDLFEVAPEYLRAAEHLMLRDTVPRTRRKYKGGHKLGKFLSQQCTARRFRFGNPHWEVNRDFSPITVRTIEEAKFLPGPLYTGVRGGNSSAAAVLDAMAIFDGPYQHSRKVEMTFDQFLGMPEKPIACLMGGGKYLAFRDEKTTREGRGRVPARVPDDDKFPVGKA